MKIVRQSEGVPPRALSPEGTVLDCDIHRSTPADWKWLDGYMRQTRKRRRPRTVHLQQRALRPYCGKPLIFAAIGIDRSVFHVFVDPKKKTTVFWSERRRQPSGRVVHLCSL